MRSNGRNLFSCGFCGDKLTSIFSAKSTEGAGGTIHIEGGDDASISASGQYAVGGYTKGGSINLLTGQNIDLTGAVLNANGEYGGGILRIGGDYQGGEGYRRARNSFVDKDSLLMAAANNLSALNYDFIYVNSTNGLTVTPALLTVTADDQNRAYGIANPTFTQTVSGFANGDTSAILTGTATGSSAANSTSTAGTYTIAGSTGTFGTTNNNYNFVAANGLLTITGGPVVSGGGSGSGGTVTPPPVVITPPPPVVTPPSVIVTPPPPVEIPTLTPPAPPLAGAIPDTVIRVSQNPLLNQVGNNSGLFLMGAPGNANSSGSIVNAETTSSQFELISTTTSYQENLPSTGERIKFKWVEIDPELIKEFGLEADNLTFETL